MGLLICFQTLLNIEYKLCTNKNCCFTNGSCKLSEFERHRGELLTWCGGGGGGGRVGRWGGGWREVEGGGAGWLVGWGGGSGVWGGSWGCDWGWGLGVGDGEGKWEGKRRGREGRTKRLPAET